MADEKGKQSKRRGSLFFPLLLVAIGLILLLQTLGRFEGDLFDIVVKLWPILLIFMGLDGIYKREGVVMSSLITSVGVVFLLINFGFLALDIWQIVFTLWPLVLIAIGFDIFIARQSPWLTVTGVVLILLILVGSLWFLGFVFNGQGGRSGQNISQSLNGITHAEIIIEPGVGNLRIDGLRNADELAAGMVSTGGTFQVEETYNRQDDAATYTLKTTGNMEYIPAFGGGEWTWNLGLTPEVPLSLYTHLGVGSTELTLSDLSISDLRTGVGVGGLTIILPARGNFNANVNGAIGKVDIYVPEGLELRLNSDLGLANLQVPPDYIKRGELYTSPGYIGSDNQVELDLEMGIGLLTIQEMDQR